MLGICRVTSRYLETLSSSQAGTVKDWRSILLSVGTMKHSTRKPTIAEQQRFQAIKEVGCVPCWLEGRSFEPCDIQHVVKGRKRLGHQWTYGCCPWHHRAVNAYSADTETMERVAGPSLARSPKDYHAKYGSEEELVELCNKMIEPYLQAWKGEYS